MEKEKQTPKPIISLRGYTIDNLQYATSNKADGSVPEGFKLTPTVAITEDLHQGKLSLDVSLRSVKNPGNHSSVSKTILITITAFFAISDELTSKEEIGKSLAINGTAIVFPYVRSIVSMITGLDSEQTILLPTIRTKDLFSDSSIEI